MFIYGFKKGIISLKLARQSPFYSGGKSGLHRVECQVTPGRRESMESATENIPPKGKGEMVR